MSIEPIGFSCCCLFSMHFWFGRVRVSGSAHFAFDDRREYSDYGNAVNAYYRYPYVPLPWWLPYFYYCPSSFVHENSFDGNMLPERVQIHDVSMDYTDGRNTFSERTSPPYYLEALRWYSPYGQHIFGSTELCKSSLLPFLCTVSIQDMYVISPSYYQNWVYPAYLCKYLPMPPLYRTESSNAYVGNSFIRNCLERNVEFSLGSRPQLHLVQNSNEPSTSWERTNPSEILENEKYLNSEYGKPDNFKMTYPYQLSSEASSEFRQNGPLKGAKQTKAQELLSYLLNMYWQTEKFSNVNSFELVSDFDRHTFERPSEKPADQPSFLGNFKFQGASMLDLPITEQTSSPWQDLHEKFTIPLKYLENGHGSQNMLWENNMNGRTFDHQSIPDVFSLVWGNSFERAGLYQHTSVPDASSASMQNTYEEHTHSNLLDKSHNSYNAFMPNAAHAAMPNIPSMSWPDLFRMREIALNFPENAYSLYNAYGQNDEFKRAGPHYNPQNVGVVSNCWEDVDAAGTSTNLCSYIENAYKYLYYPHPRPNDVFERARIYKRPSLPDVSNNGNYAYWQNYMTGRPNWYDTNEQNGIFGRVNLQTSSSAFGVPSTTIRNPNEDSNSLASRLRNNYDMYNPHGNNDLYGFIHQGKDSSRSNEVRQFRQDIFAERTDSASQLENPYDSYNTNEQNAIFGGINKKMSSSDLSSTSTDISILDTDVASELENAYGSYNANDNEDLLGIFNQAVHTSESEVVSKFWHTIDAERPNTASKLEKEDNAYNTNEQNGIFESFNEETSSSASDVSSTATRITNTEHTHLSNPLKDAYDMYNTYAQYGMFGHFNKGTSSLVSDFSSFFENKNLERSNRVSQDDYNKVYEENGMFGLSNREGYTSISDLDSRSLQNLHAGQINSVSLAEKANDSYNINEQNAIFGGIIQETSSSASKVSSTTTQNSNSDGTNLAGQLETAYGSYDTYGNNDILRFLNKGEEKSVPSDEVRTFWQNIYAVHKNSASQLGNVYESYNTNGRNGVLGRINHETSSSTSNVAKTSTQKSNVERTNLSSQLKNSFGSYDTKEQNSIFGDVNQETSSPTSNLLSISNQNAHVGRFNLASQLESAYGSYNFEKDDLLSFTNQGERTSASDGVSDFWRNIYAGRTNLASQLEKAGDSYITNLQNSVTEHVSTFTQNSNLASTNLSSQLEKFFESYYTNKQNGILGRVNQETSSSASNVSITTTRNPNEESTSLASQLENAENWYHPHENNNYFGFLNQGVDTSKSDEAQTFWQHILAQRTNSAKKLEEAYNLDNTNEQNAILGRINKKKIPSDVSSTYTQNSIADTDLASKLGNAYGSYNANDKEDSLGFFNKAWHKSESEIISRFWHTFDAGLTNTASKLEKSDDSNNTSERNGMFKRLIDGTSFSASGVFSTATHNSNVERTNLSNERNGVFGRIHHETSSSASDISSPSTRNSNLNPETRFSTTDVSGTTTQYTNSDRKYPTSYQENPDNSYYTFGQDMMELQESQTSSASDVVSKLWPEMYAGRIEPSTSLENAKGSPETYGQNDLFGFLSKISLPLTSDVVDTFWQDMYAENTNPSGYLEKVYKLYNVSGVNSSVELSNTSINPKMQLIVNQQLTGANGSQWQSLLFNASSIVLKIAQDLDSAVQQQTCINCDKKIEEMTLGWVALLLLAAAAGSKSSCDVEAPTRALLCHVGSSLHASFNPCLCSHVIFPNQDFQSDAGRLKARNPKLKVLFKQRETTAAPLPEGADGVYISLDKHPAKDVFPSELKELATKLDDLSSSKRAKAKYEGLNDETESDELEIILELPAEPKRLAKHYDIKSLAKYVRYFVVPSDNLTDSSQDGLAYHPSRLMGIDDILNADSLVDLLSSMGADHDKLIISLPAYGLQFTLKDDKNNMPGSAVSDVPEKISQTELCKLIGEGGWTLEREEDMTAPYAYKEKKWVSFDDATSASIKGKYVLLRNLGGLSVSSSEDDDWAHSCSGRPLVDVLHNTLTNLARKSRGAQLLSLQDQIHNSLLSSYSGDVQLSPFRIVRVVDRAGAVHVVRKEAKTEFQCSRQGYFTHPSGCNRFYRCVKFNQYSSDFTVFEYDCPAGLAFDERYEVCVWPGSLPDAAACKGSSEIAPVPRSRFACSQEGYYADPENCRWFFACLDHQRDGHTPPTAYEFRCPFGLVFDNEKLACDWPWKVAGCGSGQAAYATVTTGTIYPGDILEGRLRPSYAQVSDAHVSGGRIANVEGGLVLGTSLLSGISNKGSGAYTSGSSTHYGNGYGSGNLGAAAHGSDGSNFEDNRGAYVHDPSGDSGGEYLHQDGAQVPYIHQDGLQVPYVHQSDGGSYKHQGDNGAYVHQGDSGSYRGDGAYVHQGDSGVYRGDGSYVQQGDSGAYRGDGSSSYVHQGDSGDYRGDGSYVQQGDSGANRGSGSGAYVHQGDSGIYKGDGGYVQQGDRGTYRGDGSGAYVHQEDSGAYRGDGASGSGGAYSGQRDSGASQYQGQDAYIHTGGTQLAGGAYLAGGLAKSEITSSGGSSGGAYLHDSRGDTGGDYSHDGSGGPGYTHVSGASGIGAVSGGAYFANNAGSYVNTGTLTSSLKTGPVGVISGTYTLGSGYANDVKTAGIDSGAYLGGVGYVSGSKSVNTYSSSASSGQSGAYVHDTRGDSGGDYIHRDVPYIHQDGAQVPYLHQSDSGSYKQQDYSGAYIHQGDSGEYIHQGHSGAYRHDGAYNYQGNNGAYVHDSRQDNAGYYGGKYTVGQGAYNVKTNLYQGSSGVYGSGAYVHDGRGDEGGAYGQAGYKISVPVTTYGLDIYHQTSPAIHGHDASRQNVQSVGYIQPAVRVQPITVTGAPAIPLKSVQYIQPAIRPVVATTPVPSVIGYQYRKPVAVVQPISVSSTPAIPLSPVQYIHPVQKIQPVVHQTIQPVVVSTPAPPVVSYGYRTPAISTFTAPKAHVQPITVSSTPVVPLNSVQYVTSTPAPSVHVDTQRLQPVQGFSYTKTSARLEPVSYQQPIQNVYLSTPAPPTLIKTQRIQPIVGYSYPQPAVKPVVSYQQPVFVSTPAPPTQRVQPLSQVVYSTPAPTYVSSTVRPITVSSTPVVPFNPVQYNVPCTNCAVSQTARPLTVTAAPINSVQPVYSYTYTQQQQPICTSCATAQTASPITVSSAPVVPLSPVQYSTPVPAVVSYSYPKPAVKFETPVVQQTFTYKQPVDQQTYTYKQPVVQQTYAYKRPVVQQTYTYKQQVAQPIAVSTPAPPLVSYSYQKPSQPVVYSTPSPVYVSSTVSPITVSSTPVVPLNPVQYVKQVQSVQVPAQVVVGYSYPKPAVKFETPVVQQTYSYKQPTYIYKQPVVQPIAITTAAPQVQTYTYKQQQPVAQQTYTYKQPVVQQTYTYKQPVVQQTYTYKQPVAVSTPAPPVVSYSYQKPSQPVVYSTPAPIYVSSTVRPITVSSTPVVPLNPVQYLQSVSTPEPAVVSYSYPKPAVKFETPVVQQTYTYKQPVVQQTYTYKQPVVQQQTYTYKQPVVQQTYTYKQPVVQQQTYTYKQPVVQQTYTYKQPVVRPVAVSTPAPPVVSYSYQKPVQPIVYSTSAPSYVSTTVRPITVSSTPVVPLNPVQYVRPVQPTYVSTPSPPVVSYTYQKPEYKTQPIQSYNTVQYQQPIYKVTTPAPPVIVSSTPAIPLNPVQYRVPVQPAVVSYQQTLPTHAPSVVSYQPVRTQSQYVRPAEPKPIVDYSYVQQTPISYSYPKPAVRLETPVVVSTPTSPVVKYEQQYVKQVVSSPAPAVVSYSYQPAKATNVAPIQVSSTPVIPYSPVQYVRPAVPRPQVSYSYVSQPAPAPAVVNYESVKVVTTPAPPVAKYSYQSVSPVVVTTPAPAVNYYQPAIKTQTVRPYVSVSSFPPPVQYVAPAKPARPAVSYNYVEPQPFSIRTESQESLEFGIRQQPIRPVITVTSTPAVPLAPVQYVSTVQPKPIYSYSYVKPTPAVYETAAPVVTETYRVTTPRPAITVTSNPAVPLASVQYVQPAPVQPVYSYNYVRPTTTYVETPAPVVQTYKVTTPRPVIVQTTTEQPFVEYKPVRVRPAVQKVYVPAEPLVPVVQTPQQPIDYTVKVRPTGFRKTPIVVTTTDQPLGVSYYEEYFDSKKTGGYEYRQPVVQLKEERIPVTSTVDSRYGYQGEIHSSSFAPIIVPEISTAVPARRRPVQTYVNTVEEESYYSSTPGSIDVHDENLNVHLDIPRVGVSTTTPEQVVEVTTVAPAVKRVRVGGNSNVAGGYYVRKQKVRVRPFITTTENYPAFFTTTVKPVYSSTIDLSSPTLYSTTVRPTYSTTYRPSSSTADNELEVEDEDDSKLIQEVSGGFGSVLTSGDNGIIRQGSVSSTTISSLKDGEAIIGVVKKEREEFTGRRRTKVVVVSRLSDFNPLLVGKLGAECSCRDESKTLDLTKTRTRGKLFRPVTSTTVVEPSREYLPTSTTPLPDELTNFDYDDARPPGQIVEIKPVRKTQRVYSTTGAPLDVSTVEYVSSTRPARKIASASASGGRSTRLDPEVDCQRPGLFRHPHVCNKFYSCNWDEWKKRYTVSVFNCPIHLAFDSKLGACNWPSKGPACAENNLLV